MLSTASCTTSPPARDLADTRDITRIEQPAALPAGAQLLLPSSLGPISTTVRLGTLPDRTAEPDTLVLWDMGFGGGALYLGFLAPPIASAMIVGGTFLIVAAAGIYGTERHQVDVVETALRETDLPGALESALRARSLAPARDVQPVASASVEVLGWGLSGRSAAERQCFVAAVKLAVHRDDRATDESTLTIAPGAGTEGAPPPQCVYLGRFAEDGGRLVRETVRDYAEVLAVLVVERLGRIER